MVPGFNHNIQHKGRVFHIQTEDSGTANPHIVTLLYIEGTIIAKKKTNYDDLVQMDGLVKVVRELMEEQHKAMLRDLVRGNFDGLADSVEQGKPPVPQSVESQANPQTVAKKQQQRAAAPPPTAAPPARAPASGAKPGATPPPAAAPANPPPANDLASLFSGADGEKSLDEIILSYLSEDKP